MKKNEKNTLITGTIMLILFAVWTVLIQTVDVQAVGQNGTDIGFAGLNVWFHKMTGVHMWVYTVTDWLGLVPIFICMIFGVVGLVQLIKRRSFLKVDKDIILLGIYYILVIFGYLIFEMIPINYRPILIEGRMEASYPSSTTLLVMSVMPTLAFQVHRRIRNTKVKYGIYAFTVLFTAFMVVGRTVAGVHWLTDIAGSVLLSSGLYLIYHGAVRLTDKNN
ncbi:MAG: phosphatase PAP2 family protein [Ruminococcus sp.]|uniref:phosphatase PAP2 family protein n=1 Tax=Ruminococcus sp. TaxID=41978 RepID=UPI001B7BB55C|nr:phosphatase PAP2 family protein [Ruminococcus sp.]MBP5362626.1 phosphatase PAP2 family protein [Ruminococcus sp.]MCR4795752.1 phosphatase PAP2 family protein [Ruminococcus sp.]